MDDKGNDLSTEDAARQLQGMGDNVYQADPANAYENNSNIGNEDNQGLAQKANFNTLWNNYPGHHIDHVNPSTNKERYETNVRLNLVRLC